MLEHVAFSRRPGFYRRQGRRARYFGHWFSGAGIAVLEAQLLDLIDPVLRAAGSKSESGAVFQPAPLEILRLYRRTVRWSPIPLLGRAASVVAVVRQPLDIELSDAGYSRLLIRLAHAASSRISVWDGVAIGLTALIVTSEPLDAGDDAVLGRVLAAPLRRYRVVPIGLLRVNLGQEATAFTMKASPGEIFAEPALLADVLSTHLRRFVPLFEPDVS
jgi:hypothetical protein